MAFTDYIYRRGVTPNTLSVISSKNKITAINASGSNTQVGVIATFDPSEARTIEPIRGIGYGDHIAELVPGVTDPMTISVTRSALYLANIYQVFGYKAGIDGIVRSLRHHRWPFDIKQEIIFSQLAFGTPPFKATKAAPNAPDTTVDDAEDTTAGDNAGVKKALITMYVGCWMSDYSVSFASDTALVQETVTINVSDIISSTLFKDYQVSTQNLSALAGISLQFTDGVTPPPTAPAGQG